MDRASTSSCSGLLHPILFSILVLENFWLSLKSLGNRIDCIIIPAMNFVHLSVLDFLFNLSFFVNFDFCLGDCLVNK
jgi:hypothetical protein